MPITPGRTMARRKRSEHYVNNKEFLVALIKYREDVEIAKLRDKPNFVKITKAGFYESMVHNVDVIKNDSKY